VSEILKTEEGIFIPRELIPDFERAEVDASTPGVIIIRSKANLPTRKIDGRSRARAGDGDWPPVK
jgi:hypothetical protein